MKTNFDWIAEHISESDMDRFWSQVEKTDSCWIWKGITSKGYGVFYLNQVRNKVRAHRFSFLLSRGYLTESDKICVLHKCPGAHRRDCVNPNHLSEGDARENNLDSFKMGRRIARGSEVAAAKLNDEDVQLIRDIYGEFSVSYKILGKYFGVCRSIIKNVVSGRSWKHVSQGKPVVIPLKVRIPRKERLRQLRLKNIIAIRARRKAYYRANSKRIIEKSQMWVAENKEREQARQAAY
jgi:hypothetical protein